MNPKKLLTKHKKTLKPKLVKFTIIFCICLFLLSNRTVISSNLCVASPCEPFDASNFEGAEIVTDYTFQSYSNTALAPTMLLSTQVIKLFGAYQFQIKEVWYDYEMKFDRVNDAEEENDERFWNDHLTFLLVFLIIKFLVLLNVVWWVFLSWFVFEATIKHKYLRPYILGAMVLMVFVLRILLIFRGFK